MHTAAIQLNSDGDEDRNLEVAERLVRAAVAEGADLVALPEKWNLLGPGELLLERAERLDGGALRTAAGWARELGIHVLAGSIAERLEGEARIANTSALINPDGEIAALYRKIHLFDVEVGGTIYRESEHERAGDEIALGRVGELELGLSICYDLRFPELYRILALRGARAVAVPSAFTAVTGEAHWEVLLRARAIENQLFVIAPNQVGRASPRYESWGHSMIVDPWGRVLDRVAEGEGIAFAELDLEELARIRERLPALASRRPEAYPWLTGGRVHV